MRLSEASAHLASFAARIKDEASQLNSTKEAAVISGWVVVTAVKAADAVLSTCPSIYEKRCLLQLLAEVDFADSGTSSFYFRRKYWKINLSEPSLFKDGDIYEWNDSMDDASFLEALEKDGLWEQARTWARKLESSNIAWEYTLDHVTESQVFVFFVYILHSSFVSILDFRVSNCPSTAFFTALLDSVYHTNLLFLLSE
jgi:spatacsin